MPTAEPNQYRTVGDCLDAGVLWDQFATDEWDGLPLFTSAGEAEAHRDELIATWPAEGTL